MAEREQELQETVERQTGFTPGRRAPRANGKH